MRQLKKVIPKRQKEKVTRPLRVGSILIISFLLLTLNCLLFTADAAVPHLINYQGRLSDRDNRPLDGNFSLTFRIFDAESGGQQLWEETHSSVAIHKGIFSILLGSVTNLNLTFDKPYFLEIKAGNEVMNPRQQITSAGYAIKAEMAEGVRGSENIIPGSGRIGIGNLNPQAMLDIAGEGTLKLTPRTTFPSLPQEGTIFYYTNDKKLYLYTGSNGWQMLTTVAINVTYPDEKRYTCSSGSGPCNLGTQIHFTWANVNIPSIMNRLRVKYEWSSGNFAHDYYSHNIQVLVNGNAIESFITYQTNWVLRDNIYDVKSYLRYDGTDTVRIQLTDTSSNEEDWYSFRNVYLEFL